MDLIIRRIESQRLEEPPSSSLNGLREAPSSSNKASTSYSNVSRVQDRSQPASLSGASAMHRSMHRISNQSINYRPSCNGLSQPVNLVRQAGNWKQRRDKRALAIAQQTCVSQQLKWNSRLEAIIDEKLEQKNSGVEGSLEEQPSQVQKSSSILNKKAGRRHVTDYLSGKELLSVALQSVGKAERMLQHTDDEDSRQQQGQGQSARRAPDPRDFGGHPDEEDEDEEGKDVSSPLLPVLANKIGVKKWNAVKMVAGVSKEGKRDSLGAGFIASLNENISLAEAARRRQEALDRGKATRSKSVDPILPSMLEREERLGFSGTFRLNSLRRHIEAERDSVVQRNPAAFQEEASRIEEAEYRSRADLARIRFEGMKGEMFNESAVESWRSSLRSLQNSRPYFLPPAVSKEHHRRLKPEEQKALAIKLGTWEADEAALVEKNKQLLKRPSDNWNVKESQFWERRAENEARNIFDTDQIKASQFNVDWSRVVEKTRFRRYVGMEDKGVKSGQGKLDKELAEIREEVFKHKDALRSIFSYYSSAIEASFKSDSVLMMTFGPWMAFCKESGILNPSKRGCTAIDLENIFVAVNFEETSNTIEAQANDDDSMMRFEFLEGIVRAAFGTYITTGLLTDASDATEEFVRENVIANVPPEALVDPNDFRRMRLYTYDMDQSLSAYWDLLNAMFKLYKAKDKTKYLAIEHFGMLLEQAQLIGPHTGLDKREVKLIFVWSQILVSDELKRRKRAVGLVFFDFVEALARVADYISPMSTEELLETRPRELSKRASVVGNGGRRSALLDLPSCITETSIPEDADVNNGDLPVSSTGPTRSGSARMLVTVPGQSSRGLHVKFNFLCEYLGQRMQAIWGGKNLVECIERMQKTARMLSGGTELG